MLHADFDFKKPDYAKAFKQRMDFLTSMRSDPASIPQIKAYYAQNPADFISDFGVTYDPRNADIGLPTLLPFVLFEKQREWIDWVLDRWRARRPGLCEKSRDMGVTWEAIALSCTLGIFTDGLSIGFGSRKSEYVDEIGNMKAILPKGRMFMEHLPEEFRGGFVSWRDAPKMRITIPDTGSLISGEGGDDVGRGDRKAQPLTANILTPFGWRKMGDLKPGDKVIGKNGRSTKVLSVHPQGVVPLYRITFDDGASTDCCDNHLWQVTTYKQRKNDRRRKQPTGEHSVLSTKQMVEAGITVPRRDGQKEYQFQIPICDPVQYAEKKLPLHPYLLGVLLGDGSIAHLSRTAPEVTTADAELLVHLTGVLPDHVVLRPSGKHKWRLSDVRGARGRGHKSEIRKALDDLGLAGAKSGMKFIPDIYLRGSIEQRVALLRGLIDTDGWIRNNGSTGFVSTSDRLVKDVKELVQSLGGLAYESRVRAGLRRYPNGYEAQFDGCSNLIIATPMCPALLSRKAVRWKPRTEMKLTRSIIEIVPIDPASAQCIVVDADDHLYLTEGHVVTHNTIYFFDEEAHHPRQDLVAASLSQTTNCLISMSSVRGMNNLFAQKRWGGKIDVFIFDWHDDPRKDDAWYAQQCEDLDPVVVAQEIDRDYSASVSGIVIPGAWVRSCIDAKQVLGIAPSGRKGIAFDVADEGEDKNAVVHAEGTEILMSEEWSGKGSDIFAEVEYVFDLCDDLGLREFRYDSDGIGAGVRGDARVINERRTANRQGQVRAVAYRGSGAVIEPEGIVEGTMGRNEDGEQGRTNQDYFGNHKAQAWWSLRNRVKKTHRWVQFVKSGGKEGAICAADDIVSISSACKNHMKLVAELSQATFKTNEVGKIIIQKKPAKSKMKSPNLADAAVIHFAPMETVGFDIDAGILQQVAAAGGRHGRRR